MKNQISITLGVQHAMGGVYIFGVLIWQADIMLSALVGCLAALAPNTWQGIRLLKRAENTDASQWLAYAYLSELVKWSLTGMIFLLAFSANYPWDPLVFFVGFILIQIPGWFVPVFIKSNF